MLRGVVLGWVPWANVDDVGLSSSEGSWQVSLRASVTHPRLRAGRRLDLGAARASSRYTPVFLGPFVGTLGATFASQGARESALAIDDAFQYHVHRRVSSTQGMKLVARLPSVEVKDENLEASRKGKLEDGVLEEDFGLSVATGTLDTARYEEFADKAHRVDDGFQAARTRSATRARPSR